MGHTFIDNVPMKTLVLVVSNDLGDMVLHGFNECLIGPGSASDCTGQHFLSSHIRNKEHTPTRQLLIPDQVMASQFLVISLSQIDIEISIFEAEAVLGRFGSIPLYKAHQPAIIEATNR